MQTSTLRARFASAFVFAALLLTLPGAASAGTFWGDGADTDSGAADGTEPGGVSTDGTFWGDGTETDGYHEEGSETDGYHEEGSETDGYHEEGVEANGTLNDI